MKRQDPIGSKILNFIDGLEISNFADDKILGYAQVSGDPSSGSTNEWWAVVTSASAGSALGMYPAGLSPRVGSGAGQVRLRSLKDAISAASGQHKRLLERLDDANTPEQFRRRVMRVLTNLDSGITNSDVGYAEGAVTWSSPPATVGQDTSKRTFNAGHSGIALAFGYQTQPQPDPTGATSFVFHQIDDRTVGVPDPGVSAEYEPGQSEDLQAWYAAHRDQFGADTRYSRADATYYDTMPA